MKLLIDFLPIILFFFVYKSYGLNIAIIAMTLATVLQILYTRWQTGTYEKMQVVTLGLLILFGGLTIYINDPAFIMWKVTVLYVVFAGVLLASLIFKKPLLERLMGSKLELPRKVWNNITILWGTGFMVIAGINAYFVDAALTARDAFIVATGDAYVSSELSTLECTATPAVELCRAAAELESIWVDFKLFGTLGLTFVLIIVTVIMVKGYIKDEDNSAE